MGRGSEGEGARVARPLPLLDCAVGGREAVSLPPVLSGFPFRGGFLEELAQRLHVEIAVGVDPLLVGLDREGADEPQAARFVGEDAYDMRAAFELLVEPFEQVGGFEMLVVRMRQAVVSEGLLNVGRDALIEIEDLGQSRA